MQNEHTNSKESIEVIWLSDLSVFPSDIADADLSPLKDVDFYVDPEAVPPVRSLRSQSLHTSSGTWTHFIYVSV